MQSSIKNQTGNYTVLQNAKDLVDGTLKPELLRVRVWQDMSGKVWTLDHRRLASFRLAGLNKIPITWAKPSEIEKSMWKMTTRTQGHSIRLKLGKNQNQIIK
ncbi:MAG: hypothetical protein JJT94_11720 [Bernardetiaceae bacterium]|nr:hypothetical protein [Bernardetiaceae bacterium]